MMAHRTKAAYVRVLQSSMRIRGVKSFFESAIQAPPDSLARWMASLVAIYDLDRMIALDIPWWNVGVARRIDAFLKARPDARVFEYGSGASTHWLARRARHVTSVEHDFAWFEKVAGVLTISDTSKLLQRPLGPEYVNAISEAEGPFDLIVVDGRKRAACLSAAVPFLKKDGVILFDDSGRRRYRGAIQDCGLSEDHYHGRSYCVPYPDHSSILRRAEP